MTLNSYKNIHFIGIGGISMSSLAEILSNKGFKITGSDGKQSELTDHLQNIGLTVYIGHQKENLSKETDLVVYTAAIPQDNAELLEAKEKNIPAIERSVLLGLMMKDYKNPICIAGTHGKTTTSSMASEVYIKAEKDPTITIGGILPSINGNFKIGSNDYFIAESCEYCDSFLKFFPKNAIILNIDRDHTDYFKDMKQMYASFHKFASLIPNDGALIINKEIPSLEEITDGLDCKIITFGKDNSADYYPENIAYDENGCGEFDALNKNGESLHIKLNVPGLHNIFNALSIVALAENDGLDKNAIAKGLESFKGTHRRFEFKGMVNGAEIIDDYAHHPTEIKATLSASKAHHSNKVIAVFQPHTYTRTKSLLTEFSQAFDDADEILVLDIYAAREKDNGEVHSKDLVEKLVQRGKNAKYMESFEKAQEYLLSTLKEKNMLITIGAGDVYLLGENLISK